MISGALLIKHKKSNDIMYVLKNRVLPMLLKLVVVSLLIVVMRVYILQDYELSFKNVTLAFLENTIDTRMWFIYAIIGLYLCLPILNLIFRSSDRKLLWYIVIVALILTNFGLFLKRVLEINIAFSAPMMGSFIAAFVLGHLLTTTNITLNKRKLIYTAGVLSLIFTITATRYFSHKQGSLDMRFYNDINLNILMTAVAFFVYAKYSKLFNSFSRNNIVKELSKISFGFYIVHIFVFDLLKHYAGLHFFKWGIKDTFLIFVVVALLTTIISYIFSKVKVLRKIIV